MPITLTQAQELAGTHGQVYDRTGATLGQIRTLLVEDDTQRPTWVVVDPAEPDLVLLYLPLVAANVDGTDIVVPYAQQTVEAAPAVADPASGMTPEEEQTLAVYYEGPSAGIAAPTQASPASRSTPAASRGSADLVVTRSEEQLRVSTRIRPRERVRLVKHIVTETVTHTFEVRREELRVEREPWDEETSSAAGTSTGPNVVVPFDQDDVDIVLHEERLVVSVELVPVERVRLRIRTATDVVAVEDTVEVEHVDLDTTHAPAGQPT